MNDSAKEFLKILGDRIEAQRKFLGYTREQLAELAEISPRFVAYIENGEQELGTLSLLNICKALNVSADYLLFNQENSDIENITGLLKNCNSSKLPYIETIIRACKEMK